jgi:hypothetical protein
MLVEREVFLISTKNDIIQGAEAVFLVVSDPSMNEL